ncbi:hypothetical protein J7T55_005974 [Diaporthe amygdali]|uniref:uncharacterized protein n=1 Tax=Phomopsis amygdali TaxID=1214568 RepID=UPI0022FF4024|nr:uncharacterized protein J7T55_005974 [Diaporthe amygdali]KAJ0124634.1 hypothetical protein J7T55_005974 [Diaporthe amygdali]
MERAAQNKPIPDAGLKRLVTRLELRVVVDERLGFAGCLGHAVSVENYIDKLRERSRIKQESVEEQRTNTSRAMLEEQRKASALSNLLVTTASSIPEPTNLSRIKYLNYRTSEKHNLITDQPCRDPRESTRCGRWEDCARTWPQAPKISTTMARERSVRCLQSRTA